MSVFQVGFDVWSLPLNSSNKGNFPKIILNALWLFDKRHITLPYKYLEQNVLFILFSFSSVKHKGYSPRKFFSSENLGLPGWNHGEGTWVRVWEKKKTKPAVYAELQQETGTTFPELSKWTPGLLLVCGMIWGVSSNDGREQWVSHLVHFAMKIVCRYNIRLDRGWIVPLAAWRRGSAQLAQITLLLGSVAQKWSLVGGYGESSGLEV